MRHPPYGFGIYLVNVKTIRRMAQIFVAFSEKLNFIVVFLWSYTYRYVLLILGHSAMRGNSDQYCLYHCGIFNKTFLFLFLRIKTRSNQIILYIFVELQIFLVTLQFESCLIILFLRFTFFYKFIVGNPRIVRFLGPQQTALLEKPH